MAAMSDTTLEYEKSRALRRALQEASAVNRVGRVFLGTVLLVSAIGLWLVPVTDGDAGMRMIKLAMSLVMFALGAMFIWSIAERAPAPEVTFDTQNRELRIRKTNPSLHEVREETHKLDDLQDIKFKSGVFSARGPAGELLVSIPVKDAHTKKALKAALKDRA